MTHAVLPAFWPHLWGGRPRPQPTPTSAIFLFPQSLTPQDVRLGAVKERLSNSYLNTTLPIFNARLYIQVSRIDEPPECAGAGVGRGVSAHSRPQLHMPHKLAQALQEAVGVVGSSRVDLQACKLEYSIVSPK